MDYWLILARAADFIGIISLVISIFTLANTSKLRTSMLAHVETSEYRQAIDEQVHELEAFQSLLVDGTDLNSNLFLELMVLLRNISIAYETILPTKLLKKIGNLRTHIKKCLYDKEAPYNKNDMEKCISLLVEVVTELKKEKKVI